MGSTDCRTCPLVQTLLLDTYRPGSLTQLKLMLGEDYLPGAAGNTLGGTSYLLLFGGRSCDASSVHSSEDRRVLEVSPKLALPGLPSALMPRGEFHWRIWLRPWNWYWHQAYTHAHMHAHTCRHLLTEVQAQARTQPPGRVSAVAVGFQLPDCTAESRGECRFWHFRLSGVRLPFPQSVGGAGCLGHRRRGARLWVGSQ